LQLRIRATHIIGRHAGGRICIDTDHFRIPLLFILFCGFRAAYGPFLFLGVRPHHPWLSGKLFLSIFLHQRLD
jgi:hypothetical protein